MWKPLQAPSDSLALELLRRRSALAFSGLLAIGLAGCVGVDQPLDPIIDEPPPNADPQLGCSSTCHGDQNSNAPPVDTTGGTATTLRTVGAHRSHLNPAPTWHRKIQCNDCHVVPTGVGDPGHIDTAPAELAFGAIASSDGASPTWNGDSCTNAYCHGATLQGGTLNEPVWTDVDGTQSACGTCHGFAPPAPHPDNTDCGACHPTIQPGTTTFLDPDSHINGVVDLAGGGVGGACDSCHGSDGVAAPPTDLAGNTDTSFPGVGAHRAHLGPSDWHRELFCVQCHTVPVDVDSPGHRDETPGAELNFDGLNPAATHNADTSTCDNLYCHGNGRVSNGTMQWTANVQLQCDSCHEDGSGQEIQTLSGEHKKHAEEDIQCFECHQSVVNQQMSIVSPDLHINGVHDIRIESGGVWQAPGRTCSNMECHENEDW